MTKTTIKMSSSSSYKDGTPDFEKLNKEFEKYTKSLFSYGIAISLLLIFILFIILFVKLLYIELDSQSERIRLNAAIINEKFNNINDYLNLIKNSYVEFGKFEANKKQIKIPSYKDKLGRYVYNSIYTGTYISLYHPLELFVNEIQGLEYISSNMQSYHFDFLLWTYFYSKNKFVYVHPYLPNPIAYKFSEKSYQKDILLNTMKKDELYVSPVYHDMVTDQMVFSIAIPIYKDHIYQGTFAADIDLFNLFHEIHHLNKDTQNMSVSLINGYNQYFSFNKKNKFFFPDYKKISRENFEFSFQNFSIVTSYEFMWNNFIICSFPVKNIFYKTLTNSSLLYFIFATIMFYIFTYIMYFRFMRPLQNLIIGILRYLTTKNFSEKEAPRKLKRFGYKKNLINEMQSTFLYLVKQFVSKEKIDNDIRFGQKILTYFINNEYAASNYAYMIKPAFHFSGDYVRIFDLKKSPFDETVVVSKIFFIADVSGKGIGAILIVNQLNLFFDIYADQIWDLNSFEEILNKFNQYFLEKNKTCDFIAFRSIYVDYEKRETFIIDAGLPQIYCLDSKNQVSKISDQESYTPLGIDGNEYYNFKEIFLFDKYNTLFLCTDGILEQSNENGILFEEKFLDFLKNNYNSRIDNQDFIKSLWDYFYLFIQTYENQQDDFTVLIVNL